MRASSNVVYRVATLPWELEQVHRLNRTTFAGEIPQHHVEGDLLVDRFDAENTYLVAVEGERVLGMLALRDRRPFSLDEKLPGLDRHLPQGLATCEVRLLAVEKGRRNGALLPGLMRCLWEVGRERGYELAVLSAYVPRVPLYERLGCVPFGPRVGTAEVPFQPMMARREDFAAAVRRYAFRSGRSVQSGSIAPSSRTVYNFLPGPVDLEPATQAAFATAPASHRAVPFHRRLEGVRARLRELTGAAQVQVLVGSGTLANDVVAAQLSLLPGPGVVLVNGEFGQRLADHARRHRLEHRVVAVPWGEALEASTIERALEASPAPAWLWLTHCETSTGVLNDLARVREICSARGVRLCADCISSLGQVPVDLSGVFLASGVSGKALRGYPGLALVFHDHEVAPEPARLPRYLDLGLYAASGSVPFTHSSNLVAALDSALEAPCSEGTFAARGTTGAWLRSRLRDQGHALVAPEEQAAPGVVSIALPLHLPSREVGDRLAERGFLLSYESDYLLARNWIQVCTFGASGGSERDGLEALLGALAEIAPAQSAERFLQTA